MDMMDVEQLDFEQVDQMDILSSNNLRILDLAMEVPLEDKSCQKKMANNSKAKPWLRSKSKIMPKSSW